jgi:hypothetical protein
MIRIWHICQPLPIWEFGGNDRKGEIKKIKIKEFWSRINGSKSCFK